jgi:hypothetical protein
MALPAVFHFHAQIVAVVAAGMRMVLPASKCTASTALDQ